MIEAKDLMYLLLGIGGFVALLSLARLAWIAGSVVGSMRRSFQEVNSLVSAPLRAVREFTEQFFR